MAQTPHIALGDLPLAQAAIAPDGLQIRQGIALLEQHRAQVPGELAGLQHPAGVLVVSTDPLGEPLDAIYLLVQCLQLPGELVHLGGQCRVALGQIHQQGIQALGLALQTLRLGPRQIRLLLSLTVEQRLERLHARIDPCRAGLLLVTFGLQQIDPQGAA